MKLKMEGILSIGAILKHSRSMVVLWDATRSDLVPIRVSARLFRLTFMGLGVTFLSSP